jgi:RNA polymerase sigma factor (sigma-70 family)
MPIVMSASVSWEQSLPALRNRLVARARRLGVDPVAAEDLAQDTLQEAWRLRERIYDPAGVDRWLDAIFTNVYRRWARSVGQEHTVRLETSGAEVDLAEDYDLEVELERSELVELLDRALGMLPTGARDVLIGRFVEEMPLGELAIRLGLQPGTLRMRLQRGKLALRKALTTTYADDAVSFGLIPGIEAGWQETRIWCPRCGTARLRGRFSGPQRAVEFACPNDDPSSTHDDSSSMVVHSDTAAFGVTGFRSTFNKVGDEAYEFWLDRLGGPDDRHHRGAVTWDEHGCVQAHSSLCGGIKRTHPQFQALFTPEGRRFRHDHPRARAVGCREVEVEGTPALLTSFQSLTSRARLDVVLARDSFRLLRSQRY